MSTNQTLTTQITISNEGADPGIGIYQVYAILNIGIVLMFLYIVGIHAKDI